MGHGVSHTVKIRRRLDGMNAGYPAKGQVKPLSSLSGYYRGGKKTDQTSEIIVSFKTNATSNCWPAIWLPSCAQNICSQGSISNDLAKPVHYMSPSCLEWPRRPHLSSSVRLSCSQRSSRVQKAKQRTWARWMLLRDSAICCTIEEKQMELKRVVDVAALHH